MAQRIDHAGCFGSMINTLRHKFSTFQLIPFKAKAMACIFSLIPSLKFRTPDSNDINSIKNYPLLVTVSVVCGRAGHAVAHVQACPGGPKFISRTIGRTQKKKKKKKTAKCTGLQLPSVFFLDAAPALDEEVATHTVFQAAL